MDEPATEQQMRFLRVLIKEHGGYDESDIEGLSKWDASKMIDDLKKELGYDSRMRMG